MTGTCETNLLLEAMLLLLCFTLRRAPAPLTRPRMYMIYLAWHNPRLPLTNHHAATAADQSGSDEEELEPDPEPVIAASRQGSDEDELEPDPEP